MTGERPAILFSKGNTGEDLLVIPLTSVVHDKLVDQFDVLVPKDPNSNKLYSNSYARVRQLRSVSMKRLGKHLGEIVDSDVKKAINNSVKKMLGFDVQQNPS